MDYNIVKYPPDNTILYRLWRLLHKSAANHLTIFLYHAVIQSPLQFYDFCFVDVSSFRRQLKYIKRHFEVIPLSEGLKRLKSSRIYRPTAVITFDDGFQNNYDVVFPILRKMKLPATIFLTTGFLNTDDTCWPCHLHHALAETNKSSFKWDGRRFDLSRPDSKAKTHFAIRDKLKEFAQPQLLSELRKIILALDQEPDRPIETDSPFRMLNYQAIAEMNASGLIEFGAHTHSHAILSLLPSEQQRSEIERSVSTIRELTGRPCELFAYPNGRAQDYNEETIAVLKACGVRTAVTAIDGPNDENTPLMELKRYAIGVNLDMAKFKDQMWRIILQNYSYGNA